MSHILENATLTGGVVMALAAVQVVVHMIYFLHMNRKAEGGWTLMALLFTLLLVGIVLSGSMWVMHHLDVNMMPMSAEAMRQAP
jgi:cytochrome o ubiquinol oxidase operon protein cyoD